MANEKMTGNIRVVRSTHSQSFSTMNQSQLRALNDERLSLGALGLWNYICCRIPEDDSFTLEQLQAACPAADSENTAIYYQELIDCGYIDE